MNLNEWKDKNGKPVSTKASASTTASPGYKKRFEKLIKYHIDHSSSELESITEKDISNWHFRLGEHYNTGSSEFDRVIAVSYDKATKIFYLNIFVDGKQVYHNDYKSYEEVLEILTDTYMFLPDARTPEYDDLLTEWLDKSGKKINLNNSSSTSSTKKSGDDFTQQFKKLCKHLGDVHGGVKITYLEPHRMSCRVLDRNDLFLIVVKIDYLPESKRFRVSIFANDETQAINIYMQDWEYLLDQFLVAGIIKDKRLCESNSSIADDFKLYENLWEGTEEKEYYKVLGRTKYNLFDDSDLDAYLTQSAKLMRKPAENQKSMEEYLLNKIKFLLYNLTGTKAPVELIQKVQAVQSALENKIKNK